MSIVLAILGLMFLILIHEFGHFVAAKACGVKVNEFSIFMGPAIKSFQGKETKYSIRAIPIGGYVSMDGEEEASEDPRAFSNQKAWKRLIIIAAGPIMNIVLALIVMSILFGINGVAIPKITALESNSAAHAAGIEAGDTILELNGQNIYTLSDFDLLTYFDKSETVEIEYKRDGKKYTTSVTPNYTKYILNITLASEDGENSNLINDVGEGGPAAIAGIKAGDRIIAINGDTVSSRPDISDALQIYGAKGENISVTLLRGTETITLNDVSIASYQYDILSAMGVREMQYIHHPNPIEAVEASMNYFVSTTRSVFISFKWLFTGKVAVKEMSGPVGIVSLMSSAVDSTTKIAYKMFNFFSVLALISVNLGVANLLPIPALDGSKILFLIIECITRKRIPISVESKISLAGLVVLMLFMLYVTFNDVVRGITGGFNFF